MPDQPATPTPAHPSLNHRRRAADHLRQAAAHLDEAVLAHEQRAHATAGERCKEAANHIGEARAHLREADRLHQEYEQSH